MPEIIKTYRESLPRTHFIGKRYTDKDRVNDNFTTHWNVWFENGWLDEIERANEGKLIDDSYVGLMLGGENASFYWIGIFCTEDATIPEGYEMIELPAKDAAVCWIQGQEGPELFCMHDACVNAMTQAGLSPFYQTEDGLFIFFERYNCPRYTTPDDQGRVILDYGAFLA